MAGAGHPRSLGLHERQHGPEIQRAPALVASTLIKPRRPAPAHAAATALAPVRPSRAPAHDRPALADPDVLDDRSPQPEQPRPYPDPAQVAPPLSVPGLKKPEP